MKIKSLCLAESTKKGKSEIKLVCKESKMEEKVSIHNQESNKNKDIEPLSKI